MLLTIKSAVEGSERQEFGGRIIVCVIFIQSSFVCVRNIDKSLFTSYPAEAIPVKRGSVQLQNN